MTFFLFVVGLGRASSWVLGLDDEIKAWASANRPLIAVMMGLSLIVYAIYDALQERDR